MTNAEAIAMLKRMQEPEAWEPQINAAAFEALNMAIAALGKDTDVPATDDLISRKAAIDAIEQNAYRHTYIEQIVVIINDLPSAEPKQHGRVFKGIVVEYPAYNTYPEYKGKPYFSIKYTENGQEFIGYGTYKPEVLSEYLKEYFMPSTEPEILSYLTDRPCAVCKCHTDDGCSKWECVFEGRIING